MGWLDSIAKAFSADGVVARVTEKIPVVGLVTAAVQAATGNPEHAKRALANQANAVITTAGTVGGFVVGGPIGAVAGGALASGVGIVAEYGVSTTIDDKEVKGSTGDTSFTRFTTDAALGGVGGLIGGGGAGAVIGKEIGKQVGGSVIKTAGGALLAQGAKGITQGLTLDPSSPVYPPPPSLPPKKPTK